MQGVLVSPVKVTWIKLSFVTKSWIAALKKSLSAISGSYSLDFPIEVTSQIE